MNQKSDEKFSFKDFSFQPIGFVRSCFKEKFATPRQAHIAPESRGYIEIRPNLNPDQALSGLEDFSHIWLIWIFHKNSNKSLLSKVHPPRLNGESIGIFATRSPHHPNPMGLSLVKLERVDKSGLEVSGIDLIDGTPVLDIRPYLEEADHRPPHRMGWTENIKPIEFEVIFSREAEQELFSISHEVGIDGEEVKRLIHSVLKEDPRPQVYRGDASYRETHAFYIYDFDVHFRFNHDHFEICQVRKRVVLENS